MMTFIIKSLSLFCTHIHSNRVLFSSKKIAKKKKIKFSSVAVYLKRQVIMEIIIGKNEEKHEEEDEDKRKVYLMAIKMNTHTKGITLLDGRIIVW